MISVDGLKMQQRVKIYQPVPFSEFKELESRRPDSVERYEKIKADYGDFKLKSMIDLCSANCYFGFRFIQDGGFYVLAIEKEKSVRDFVNSLAKEKDIPLICVDAPEANTNFDIGLYLDTHYHEHTEDYLDFIAPKVKILYTSCINKLFDDKDFTNERYEKDLKNYFSKIEKIYTGYQNRNIYKCC